MSVGLQSGFPYRRQQSPKRRISCHTTPQSKQVDEEPYEPFRLECRTIRNIGSDHNFLLAGVARQQYLKCREKRHEQSYTFFSAECLQSICQLFWPGYCLMASARITNLGASAISGQVQKRRN